MWFRQTILPTGVGINRRIHRRGRLADLINLEEHFHRHIRGENFDQQRFIGIIETTALQVQDHRRKGRHFPVIEIMFVKSGKIGIVFIFPIAVVDFQAGNTHRFEKRGQVGTAFIIAIERLPAGSHRCILRCARPPAARFHQPVFFLHLRDHFPGGTDPLAAWFGQQAHRLTFGNNLGKDVGVQLSQSGITQSGLAVIFRAAGVIRLRFAAQQPLQAEDQFMHLLCQAGRVCIPGALLRVLQQQQGHPGMAGIELAGIRKRFRDRIQPGGDIFPALGGQVQRRQHGIGGRLPLLFQAAGI